MGKHRAVFTDIAKERKRQDKKWGIQNHPDGTGRPASRELADYFRSICQKNEGGKENWQDILQEEFYEAMAESDPVLLRAELIQVAAVACSWIQAIDRREVKS